jgi:WD40 repeat protein
LAFSSDGEIIAAVHHGDLHTPDGAFIRLWETSSGRAVGRVGAGVRDIKQVVFSPFGRLLAFFGSSAREVVLWDAGSATVVRQFAGPGPIASAIAFSPDGKRLACGFAEGSVVIWDVETGEVAQALNEKIGKVLAIAFSPDGARLVTAGANVTALWNLSKSQVERYMTSTFSSVAFSDDGRWLATASQAVQLGMPAELEKSHLILWDISSLGGAANPLSGGTDAGQTDAQTERLASSLRLPNPSIPVPPPKWRTEMFPAEQRRPLRFSPGFPVSESPLYAW